REAGGRMQQLAPASIVVATRLRTAREKGLRPHRRVLGTAPRGRARRAPANVEDFPARIGVRLAIGAIGTSNRRGVRQEVRHRPMAKDSVAISISHLNPCWTPDTKGFRAGVLPLQQPVGLGRSRWVGGRFTLPD